MQNVNKILSFSIALYAPSAEADSLSLRARLCLWVINAVGIEVGARGCVLLCGLSARGEPGMGRHKRREQTPMRPHKAFK